MKKRWAAAVLSLLIWGSGQFFICKQKIKGSIFFAVQFLIILVELMTGYWIEYLEGQISHFEIGKYGGLFTKGVWGFVTLGKQPGVNKDHSTTLMIQGIVVILLLMFITFIFIWNIIDAYKTAKRIEETHEYISTKKYLQELYHKSFAYIVLAPIAILVIFFVVMPIIFSILTAFTNYNRNHIPPMKLVSWVGVKNFVNIFKVPVWTQTFFRVLKWTVIWTLIATFSTFFFGMFQAILLNSKHVNRKCQKLYRSIMILPWAIPQMISLLVFKNLLNCQFGPINQFLINIGLIDQKIGFLTDPTMAKITILLVNLWLGFPMYMIMIQGVLSNIDQSLYESAAIDGASSFKSFTKITLPLVSRATAPLVIMSLANNFNGFGAVFFLTDGGPANASMQFAGETDILISWIYKMTLNEQMYNMAAVMCIILFVFIASISVWNFRRTRAFKEVSE